MVSIYIQTGLATTPIQSYQYLIHNLFAGLSIYPTETFFLNSVTMDFLGAAPFGGGYTITGPASG